MGKFSWIGSRGSSEYTWSSAVSLVSVVDELLILVLQFSDPKDT